MISVFIKFVQQKNHEGVFIICINLWRNLIRRDAAPCVYGRASQE